jgi:integrase
MRGGFSAAHAHAAPVPFRAMASTNLNELGFRVDVIETQLAHKEPDSVRLAYNRAQYMEEHRKMMQAWADWLDAMRLKA